MPNSVVIVEKNSQARNVKAAVGTQYGVVLPARGHLIGFEEPQDRNPAWKEWGFDVLRPDGDGFYRFKPDRSDGKGELIDAIANALSSAKRLIISCDADREGQGIGESLARFHRFNGEIWRVMFTSEDQESIREAFRNMRPNSEYLPLYSAFFARAQADMIANLSATRAATLALKPKWMKGALGVGRVRTPTLALVASREREILTFTPRAYYTAWLDAAAADGKTVRLHHKPRPEDRILDQAVAEAIVVAARSHRGPVAVKKERKKAKPPRLMDLPTLQKRASAFGWTATKTLDIAQSLYENAQIITYPRAETKHLPEALIPFMDRLLSDLRKIDIFEKLSQFDPIIRKGKSGFFSDAGLDGASHHAIIPNPNMAAKLPSILPKLSADERKLFDLIARSLVSALSPDHVYDRTEIATTVDTAHGERTFNVVGRVTVDPGWKEAFGVDDDEDDKDNEEDAGVLPDFKDGEPIAAIDAGLDKAMTTPPPRYTEGSLIEQMSNIYKLLPEGSPQRARLQEAKGIGTPATRAAIIEGLKRQQQLELVKKTQLKPTELGMAVFEIFEKAAPEIIDPVATAELEFLLDEIMTQRSNPREVVDAITENTRRFVESMRARHASGEALGIELKRTPSPKMVQAADSKAKAQGITLTKEQKGDYAFLSDFLGPMPERRDDGTYPPSERALEAARKLSQRLGIDLDEDTCADRDRLSKWMDRAIKRSENEPASDKQMHWVRKLVEEDGAEPPKGYPDSVTVNAAKRFLDKNMGKRKSAGGQKQAGPRGKGGNARRRPQLQTKGSVRYDPNWFAPR